MKSWADYTKKELLALPVREWGKVSEYDSVLLVNTKRKHDSGYNYFAVIGVNGAEPVEIAAFMDDFRYADYLDNKEPIKGFAFDCSMHGVFRLHSWNHKIGVGHSLSTTDLMFKARNEQ